MVYWTVSRINSNRVKELEDTDDFLLTQIPPLKSVPKQFDPLAFKPKYKADEVVYVQEKKSEKALEVVEEEQLVPEVEAEEPEVKFQVKDSSQLDSIDDEIYQFYENLFGIYMDHFPQIGPIKRREDVDQLQGVNMNDHNGPVLSEKYLSDALQISQQQFDELQRKHRSLVNNIDRIQVPKNLFRGQGIVMVGDDTNLLLSLLVIKTIRHNLNSKVDIELMILREQPICDTILKNFNVTCVPILQKFNDRITNVWNFDQNLYKSLLILNSNFEKVLYLDPKTFPIQDPESLFTSQPFSSLGLVLWPDYWRRMTSPTYYKIVEKTLDIFRTRTGRNNFEQNTDSTDFYEKIPLHDRGGTIPDGTSLSELVLIDKSLKLKEFLLSLYYNINGHDFYYPLLTNFARGIGEGEKLTLPLLLNFFNSKWHQVKKDCQIFGMWTEDNDLKIVGAKQFNPVKDYRNLLTYQRQRSKFDELIADNEVAFITINNPSLLPTRLMSSYNELRDNDGDRYRLLGEVLTDFGYDLELTAFDFFKKVICELRYDFAIVEDRKKLCKFINLHLTYLKSNTKEIRV